MRFKFKALICAIAFVLCVSCISSFSVIADGVINTSEKAKSDLSLDAEATVLMECDTHTILNCSNEKKQYPISHLTKLMTALLVAEKLESNKTIKLSKKLIVSEYANSMGGTQIWLNEGEEISIEELVYSITMGNANDACITLVEGLYGSEKEFVKLMNLKATYLGMTETKFVDSTGISDKNVSSAYDLAILSSELQKHSEMKKYYTTWIKNVRVNSTELVNLNTLVKKYNGITGLKACYSKASGNCIVATAKRNNMSLVCVCLGGKEGDNREMNARTSLDYGFQCFEKTTPSLPKESLEDISVKHGENIKVKVETNESRTLVEKKGIGKYVDITYKRKDNITAPIEKGDKLGEIYYKNNGKVIKKLKIIASENDRMINISIAVKMLLCNMLK